MGMKTDKVMEILVALKISGKSALYGDLLRSGFDRAHIENAIDTMQEYGYEVVKDNNRDNLYTKLIVR